MAQTEIHLRDYLAVIYKHDFLILLSFLVILGSALTVGLHIPKTYEASTLILVYPNKNFNIPSDNIFRSMLSGGANLTEMETINRRLSSESLLQSVIETLEQDKVQGVKYLPSVSVLKRRIHAETVPDTRFINVSIQIKEQEGGERNAAIFVNKLVGMLQNVLEEEQNSEAQLRMSVIEKELDVLEASLSEREEELLDFMRQYGIPNLWYEQLSQKLEERRNVVDLREQTYVTLSNSELELNKLNEELKDYPELIEYSRTLGDNPLWIRQLTELDEIDANIADTKARLGPDAPELKGLEAQKKKRESILQNLSHKTTYSITETLSPIHLSLIENKIAAEIQYLSSKNMLKQWDTRLEKIDGELVQLISSIPETQFKFDQLTKEIESLHYINRELYKQKIEAKMLMGSPEYGDPNLTNRPFTKPAKSNGSLRQKTVEREDDLRLSVLEDSEGFKGRPKGGISIIDKAHPQKIPVSPKLLFIVAIAAIVGISIGLAAAFMFDYFDNRYHSPEEVKSDLDIPLLGSIPMRIEKRGKIMWDRNLLQTRLGKLERSKTDPTLALPVEDKPTSQIAESYRALATNINFAFHEIDKKAIMVTSGDSGDIKSYTVANLGIAMAQAKGPTVIIDCNLKHPIQHRIFGISENELTIYPPESERKEAINLVGLYDLIVHEVEIDKAIQKTRVPNLDLIVSGYLASHPNGLLNSPNMTEIIKQLKSSYNVIICDGPPVLQMSDGLVLASNLDGTILLVDLERNPKDILRHTKEQLHKLGVNLLGLICV